MECFLRRRTLFPSCTFSMRYITIAIASAHQCRRVSLQFEFETSVNSGRRAAAIKVIKIYKSRLPSDGTLQPIARAHTHSAQSQSLNNVMLRLCSQDKFVWHENRYFCFFFRSFRLFCSFVFIFILADARHQSSLADEHFFITSRRSA